MVANTNLKVIFEAIVQQNSMLLEIFQLKTKLMTLKSLPITYDEKLKVVISKKKKTNTSFTCVENL